MISTDQFTEYNVGCPAYIDAFNGRIPCIVVEVMKPGANGHLIGHNEIKVRVTKTTKGYRRGEILTRSAAYTPPRRCYRQNGYSSRILTDYQYV